jgi:hypothetical protein
MTVSAKTGAGCDALLRDVAERVLSAELQARQAFPELREDPGQSGGRCCE